MALQAGNGRVVVDFGAHLHPSADPQGSFGYIEETEGPIYRDVDAALERFRAGGLDGAVVSQARYIGHDDAAETRDANDELLSVVEPHDELFALASLPNALGGAASAEELDRCLEAGFNGAAVQTRAGDLEIADESFEPLWEAADATGVPILLHPLVHDSLGPGVLEGYELNSIFGREVTLAVQVSKLIHDGVLDRHPDLNLVVHHTAGNIATMVGRIRGVLKESRRESLDGLKNADAFLDQLGDRLYLDTSGYEGDPTVYRAAIETFSADQVMLGTDFPYETRTAEEFRNVAAGVEAAAPDEAAADRMLGGNALDLLLHT